jgi:hypothetical protein
LAKKIIGTLKTLNVNNEFKTTYGTLNKHYPSSFYIYNSALFTPTSNEKINHFKTILRVSKNIKQFLNDTLDKTKYNVNRTIVNISGAESINPNQQSFMEFQIYLYQLKPYINFNSNEMANEVTSITNSILKIIIESDKFKINRN